jgi:hypothetical protein
MGTWIAQQRQARDLEIRGSSPGPGSIISLENIIIKNYLSWKIILTIPVM